MFVNSEGARRESTHTASPPNSSPKKLPLPRAEDAGMCVSHLSLEVSRELSCERQTRSQGPRGFLFPALSLLLLKNTALYRAERLGGRGLAAPV